VAALIGKQKRKKVKSEEEKKRKKRGAKFCHSVSDFSLLC
jgi:hypothetical protein